MTIQRILLDDERFTQCLHQYIVNEKPDPIQKKQLESWNIVWTNDENENEDKKSHSTTLNDESLPDDSDADIIPIHFTPTHIVSGTLQISTEYLILFLYTKCVWMGEIMNGSIRFTCHVSVHPKMITTSEDDNETSKRLKKKKDSTRISTTMLDRLCRDEFIRKILINTTKKNGGNMNANHNHKRYLFCSASMDTKKSTTTHGLDENEERVYCDEVIGEAIRRTIYSSSDSVLDIIDILFRLPYLPCTSGNDDDSTSVTKLADRVRLRLLEEATYDACDNEPDDEIVDDLSIKDNNIEDYDNVDDHDDKNTEISRKNKKVKR